MSAIELQSADTEVDKTWVLSSTSHSYVVCWSRHDTAAALQDKHHQKFTMDLLSPYNITQKDIKTSIDAPYISSNNVRAAISQKAINRP